MIDELAKLSNIYMIGFINKEQTYAVFLIYFNVGYIFAMTVIMLYCENCSLYNFY